MTVVSLESAAPASIRVAPPLQRMVCETELVGGDVVLTMPPTWQVRFNASGLLDPDVRAPVGASR